VASLQSLSSGCSCGPADRRGSVEGLPLSGLPLSGPDVPRFRGGAVFKVRAFAARLDAACIAASGKGRDADTPCSAGMHFVSITAGNPKRGRLKSTRNRRQLPVAIRIGALYRAYRQLQSKVDAGGRRLDRLPATGPECDTPSASREANLQEWRPASHRGLTIQAPQPWDGRSCFRRRGQGFAGS